MAFHEVGTSVVGKDAARRVARPEPKEPKEGYLRKALCASPLHFLFN